MLMRRSWRSCLTSENEIETARAELLKHTAAAERLHELARQLERQSGEIGAAGGRLGPEGERPPPPMLNEMPKPKDLNQQTTAAREKLARLTAEREAAIKAVVEGHERVSDTDAEQTRVRDDHSRALHRLESFKELDQRRAHYLAGGAGSFLGKRS